MDKEKAKAYDEALERARKWYNNPNSSSIGKSYLYAVFPELAEAAERKFINDVCWLAYRRTMRKAIREEEEGLDEIEEMYNHKKGT